MVVQETSGDVTLNSQVVEGTALARHSGEEVSRSDVHVAVDPIQPLSSRRRLSPLRFITTQGASAPVAPPLLSRTPSDEGFEAHHDLFRSRDNRPPKMTSSEGLLAHVLNKMPDHLDLTGKVIIDDDPIAARGGFADVFKGYCPTLDKKVAVKRLRLHVGGNWDVIKNFAKEIRIWSRLSHPNVMQLLGYTVEGGHRSLVSEWMEKGSLSRFMAGLTTLELFSMCVGIARGLYYLHSNKVIHSDLKTDNVLVSPSGTPLLADFGISKLESSAASSPAGLSTETVRGSTRWLAYEFFEIKDGDYDASGRSAHDEKTDVWAFGMTILELLTGEIPFAKIRNDLKVIFVIVNKTLPDEPTSMTLSEVSPAYVAVRRYMWSICTRCWIIEPGKRPSIGVLLKEMEEFHQQHGVPVQGASSATSTSYGEERDGKAVSS